MVRPVLIGLLLAATGCVRGGGSYRCATSSECTLDGVAGVCEATGYCSFPDMACPDGFRYGSHAGSYSNDCVTAENSGVVTIGGTVNGLTGTNLVLRNNGGDDLLISAPGMFSFENTVMTGTPYEVTIAAQPSNPVQVCSVTNGTGTAGLVDVTDVDVTCATSTYTVGGTVVGLVGTGLVLTNNGGDDKTVTGSGTVPFTFGTQVASGAGFAVAIKTQPSGQTCSVGGGTGTVGSANISSVVINCNAGTYLVGGTISGLEGSAVLKNNGTDTATVTANGTFAFPTPLATSAAYAVTVGTQPTYPPRSQTCTVSSGSGTVGTSNVTSVSVACTTASYSVGGSISGLSGTIVLANGSDTVSVSASGSFTFPMKVLSGNTYNVTIMTQPAGQTCSLLSASGTVGNGNITSVSVNCGTGGDPGILCGTIYCNPKVGELCCVTNGVPACATTCNGGGTIPYRCDDKQDCVDQGSPTTVCCASVSGTTVNSLYCGGQTQCTDPRVMYCDPNDANPCPNGGTCTATIYPFPGYYRCQ